ncbi:rCG24652, isoform CRA_c [Rattus norvegicus]|uniref:RCG24652, isoform CRA_c n=1 Tax=Rattus norvegicus TaxID=10116 RepID=A6JCL0_RAT|nr:rCG24652, isoform CRA_c [Rattus norvegicus]
MYWLSSEDSRHSKSGLPCVSSVLQQMKVGLQH